MTTTDPWQQPQGTADYYAGGNYESDTYDTGVFDTAVLEAEEIGVDASWGHIYGPVSLRVFEGGVTVLSGPGGRGRTALLLTLAGRMKPTTGKLTSFGRADAAKFLFDQAAIGFIDEIDEIEQTISVRDVVTEQIRWRAPWYKWVRQSNEGDLEQICRPLFGELPLPSMDAYVEELPELTAALFRISVANLRRPPLLVVGGIDKLTRIDNTLTLLDRLVVLGRTQTVITADINPVSPEHGVRDVIAVNNLTDAQSDGFDQEDRT